MSSSASTKTAIHFRTSHMALSSAFGRQLTVPPRRGDSTRPVQPRTGHSGARLESPAMSLRLYDTRRGEKVPFAPIGDGPIGLYVCGVTPYDTGHLGHAFTYLSFDVLHRYLEYLGHQVVYVQNLTDVDDDMLQARPRSSGVDYLALGNRHVTTFLTEMAALNWLPPDHYPRATAAHRPDAGADRQAAGARPRLPGARATSTSPSIRWPAVRRALGPAARGDAADRQRARQRAGPARQARPARLRAVAAIGSG